MVELRASPPLPTARRFGPGTRRAPLRWSPARYGARLEPGPTPQPGVCVRTDCFDSHDSSTANTSLGAQNHGPLDHILQLTDVARPVVGLQQIQRLLVNRADGLARPGGVAVHEVFDEHQDVVLAFSKGRHLDGEHVEPIEQVLSEASIRHRGAEITIGRGDDTHVNADRLRASDPLKFPFLQDSQQRDLSLRQQLAHFVQEDRAAISQFETPKPPLGGARERASLMAEQF